MKKSFLIIALVIFSMSFCNLFAQNFIDISTVEGKINLKLQSNGKMFDKTYNNWIEIGKDKKLQRFASYFVAGGISIDSEELLQFGMQDHIKINSKGSLIEVEISNKNDEDGQIVISIDNKRKREK